jgi:hypothetical protein
MLLVPVLSGLLVCWIYLDQFGLSINPIEANEKPYAAFGQFGDYFGGVLNPLLAFMNIALLAYYQKTSIAKSAEKDVVFRMLELQSKIVASFELRTKFKKDPEEDGDDAEAPRVEPEVVEEINSGLRAFWIFDKEIKIKYQKLKRKADDSAEKRLQDLITVYSKYYHAGYRKQYLGHYFRNLYHIFKLIHESEVFSDEEKLKYAKIVRAQMSHIEQKLLYLNCKLPDGKAFQKYVATYELLEWINDKEFDNYDTVFSKSSVIADDINSWQRSGR